MAQLTNEISSKIFDKPSTLLGLTQKWKENNESIVFTNGCFDIIHRGHLDYLEATSKQGNKLVIGLNSDDSVRRLKGEERPIQTEADRAYILASLAYVDAVVLFNEDTPINLITSIIPDVLVKGGDYQIADIVGGDVVTDHGGRVITIPIVYQISTSAILEKIKRI